MRLLINPESRQHRNWCALIVLAAVCSLTVSVATRYCSLGHAGSNVTSVQKRSFAEHSFAEPGRQRLLKNATAWQPPVVCSALLLVPIFYDRIALQEPSIPNRVFEESLFSRPPPSA